MPRALLFISIHLLLLSIARPSRAERVIPFEFRDGLIWVKVDAASSATPLRFLLDSGAGSSVLSTDAARRMAVPQGAATKIHRVGAESAGSRAAGFHASLAGIPISDRPLVMDLSRTSAVCCRPIDGLIGQDFFRGRVVQIDFKEGVIRVLDQVGDGPCCAVVQLKMAHDALCVPLSVNGSEPKWTRLDTGCDDGLHWVGGANGSYARTMLQLGGEHLTNVKTAMHRNEIFPAEAGLLGNGVLSNYRVTIDAVKGRLLLQRS